MTSGYSEKRTAMPANSSKLGFNCKCGEDYGSLEVVIPKNWHKKDTRKVFGRPESDRIQIPKRSTLKPVEYVWKNKIESELERERLTHRINEIKSLLSNNSLLPEDRKKLQEEIELFASKIESEIRKRKQEDLENTKWDVTEDITDEAGKKATRIWNPIKRIKEYRESGDRVLHFNPPLDFYAKAAAKHSYAMTEYISEGQLRPHIRKGFDTICTYREPFYDTNWRYTWPEWCIIVMYAEAKGSRKAAKMLRALDGEEGKMSRRYIDKQKKRVSSFVKDFYEYFPYFVDFCKAVLFIIENDPELNEEHERILKEKVVSRQNYENKIKQQYINSSHEDSNNGQFESHEDKAQDNENVRILDNGVLEVGLERIRTTHSNPNYNKEMREFEKQLGKKPSKKDRAFLAHSTCLSM